MSELTEFKKFEGKIMAGAVALVIALTSAVWAITWHSTNATAEEARAEVEKVKIQQAADQVKIRSLEGNLEHMSKTLDKILEELRRR